MTRRTRAVIDVSTLDDVGFESRSLVWWGTLAFILVEGFTLALCAVAWIYLSRNAASWPPLGTPRPGLLWPTVEVVVMVASIPWIMWTSRRAHEFDFRRTRLGLTVATAICGVVVTLRLLALLLSLDVKWNTNAYGSAQWLVIGTHLTLQLMQLVEMAGFATAFWLAPIERKHFSDAADAAGYWYFMVAVWLPLYIMCFLLVQ